MNAIEQAKQALEAAKHFTEDMHILPPEWCADESVKLKVRLESALAALSAPAQMTDAELPPMPEPGLLVPVIAKGGTWKGYTVEQMQDYALAAIESRAISSAAGQEPVPAMTIGEAFEHVGGYWAGADNGCPTFGSAEALKVYTIKMQAAALRAARSEESQ